MAQRILININSKIRLHRTSLQKKDIFVDNNRKNKNSNFAPIAKEQHPKRTDILYLGASTLSAAIQNLTSNIH